MTISRLIMVAMAVCALTACSNTLQQLREAGFDIKDNVQTGDIDFKVKANGSDLVIENNPNQRCDKLTRKDKFKQTSDANAYYFSAFQICVWAGGDAPPDRNNCGLTVPERRDFSVEFGVDIVVPDEHGRVDLSSGATTKPEQFRLWTTNRERRDYFYWVDVCPKAVSAGDPSCLTVDPGSRNGGVRN